MGFLKNYTGPLWAAFFTTLMVADIFNALNHLNNQSYWWATFDLLIALLALAMAVSYLKFYEKPQ